MLDVGNKRSLCVGSEDLPDRPQAFADEATSTATEHAASTAAKEARASMASGPYVTERRITGGSFTPYVMSNAASPERLVFALLKDGVSSAFRPYWLQERNTTRGHESTQISNLYVPFARVGFCILPLTQQQDSSSTTRTIVSRNFKCHCLVHAVY